MKTALLYINTDESIAVIDIPTSIQEAQNNSWQVLSCPALTAPHRSLEPKSAKRDKYIEKIANEDLQYHHELRVTASIALREVFTAHVDVGGSLYLARHCPQQNSSTHSHVAGRLDWNFPSDVSRRSLTASINVPLVLSSSEVENRFWSIKQLRNTIVVNPRSTTSFLVAADGGTFLIPPESHFILSSIADGMMPFEQYVRCLDPMNVPTPISSQGFHLILMDPPWTNRSVHRAGTYTTTRRQVDDPFDQTIPIIQHHLHSNGLVAIWITNSYKVRKQVFQTMSNIGLNIKEEWIWLKVTAGGHPICRLDGVQRRPYEILLVFHRGSAPSQVRRRTIIAVPDLHSRKPALKQILEPMLPYEYRALELFARSLTAGWWSWGCEVLKYQHLAQRYNGSDDEDQD